MDSMSDPLLSSLLNTPQDAADRALAARHAPVLLFDLNEPFYPLAAGYTIFRCSGLSPSFRKGRRIELTPEGEDLANLAVEYAIWWDWDIGHLYELEHVWVYVDERGRVVRGEASWHGDYHDMRHKGQLALKDGRLAVYSEPGKHAFAPTPDWFRERHAKFKRSPTSALAGRSGVLVTEYLEGAVERTPLHDRLAHTYLADNAFEPSWDFSNAFRFAPEMLVPWPALRDWMPIRVKDWLARLARELPPSSYRFLRIGHRGARAHVPDNTLASLRAAAELGADVVEFDVRWTADGQVAVVHDAYLADASGRLWPVHRSTLAELRAIDLGGGERVPTLDEALDTCQAENVAAYIELKDGAVIPAVVDLLREHKMAGYCVVGSFRPDWVAEVKAVAPEIHTSILFACPHLDPVDLARSVGATYVHPCWERFPNPSALLTPEWIARVRGAGLGILCWHEERPEEIAALRRLGVDGICSDAPELLVG
jgi:glycerophosphoryl diester phosphodiesterase